MAVAAVFGGAKSGFWGVLVLRWLGILKSIFGSKSCKSRVLGVVGLFKGVRGVVIGIGFAHDNGNMTGSFFASFVLNSVKKSINLLMKHV
ncbi:MAG TPA: hypothetical protein PLP05_11250 [Sedimentisphaerales bacterium]|nr:hypothetical protein [Sedimentisphaerales bacterium]